MAALEEKERMFRTSDLIARLAFPTLIGAALAGSPAGGALAAGTISEQEAHSIGVQAYLYLYPLVTTDLTRKQLTNVVRPEGIAAPMNSFANVPEYPTADMKVVVRPNFDTLYSSAWLDLTKATDDRFRARYSRPLLFAADARHVDRRFRLARLAHDGDRGA